MHAREIIFVFVCVCVCVCERERESLFNPVGCGCRICQLHLCSGVRHPTSTSVLDMTLNFI